MVYLQIYHSQLNYFIVYTYSIEKMVYGEIYQFGAILVLKMVYRQIYHFLEVFFTHDIESFKSVKYIYLKTIKNRYTSFGS